jgi:hypothetical protein
MLVAVVVSTATVSALPLHGREPPSAPPVAARSVLVRGTVLDYRRRLVPDASVSGTGDAGYVAVRTDAQGAFLIRVLARSGLSAAKYDMLGHAAVGDAAEQTVVIVMAQMPM